MVKSCRTMVSGRVSNDHGRKRHAASGRKGKGKGSFTQNRHLVKGKGKSSSHHGSSGNRKGGQKGPRVNPQAKGAVPTGDKKTCAGVVFMCTDPCTLVAHVLVGQERHEDLPWSIFYGRAKRADGGNLQKAAARNAAEETCRAIGKSSDIYKKFLRGRRLPHLRGAYLVDLGPMSKKKRRQIVCQHHLNRNGDGLGRKASSREKEMVDLDWFKAPFFLTLDDGGRVPGFGRFKTFSARILKHMAKHIIHNIQGRKRQQTTEMVSDDGDQCRNENDKDREHDGSDHEIDEDDQCPNEIDKDHEHDGSEHEIDEDDQSQCQSDEDGESENETHADKDEDGKSEDESVDDEDGDSEDDSDGDDEEM